jgi:hypothetical protein
MSWSSFDRGTTRNKLEDLGIDGSTILKRILRKKVGCVDWIDVAQHWGKWWSFCEEGNEHVGPRECERFS